MTVNEIKSSENKTLYDRYDCYLKYLGINKDRAFC